ncbi:MAG: DUF1549 and DUF1553 domain-containing protein [Verrucomicrobiota bacterium]
MSGTKTSPLIVALLWLLPDASSPSAAQSAAAAESTPDEAAHWAFRAPQAVPVPAVKQTAWTRNPIDSFILARLEAEGIEPSPEADRATLIRRLSLDLLGLPPTPAEVEAFERDATPRAYENLVERLLASPHFGEQWARHWLDLARYADSDGYEKDGLRPSAYVFRDWVIEAINADLPFDRFTIEQLAGDLLPEATGAQRIATGFHRNTLANKEDGVDAEEFRCRAVADRVNTTATVWLGLTVACAECHTHKHDPISLREYYQLYAFFNHADELDADITRPVESKTFRARHAAWQREADRLSSAISEFTKNDLPAAAARWAATARPPRTAWTVLSPTDLGSQRGAVLERLNDDSVIASGINPNVDTFSVTCEAPAGTITGFRLEVFGKYGADRTAGRGRGGAFTLTGFSARMVGAAGATPLAIAGAQADFSNPLQLAPAVLDDAPATGWSVTPKVHQRHVLVLRLSAPLVTRPGDRLVFQLEQASGEGRTLRRFRFSATAAATVDPDPMPDEVAHILRSPAAARTELQNKVVARYYAELDPHYHALQEKLQHHMAAEPARPPDKVPVLHQTAQVRPTHVHMRGDFLRPGPAVQPGTPEVLPAFTPRGSCGDRLDLAQWLVSPANPLTSRVVVNRVWQHLFGRGLVATPDDFGTQGEAPSHPELLDWLALRFQRDGWSRKALIRLIVNAAAYRQRSDHRRDLTDRDPLNTLLARQGRWRLSAENVRDAALSVSGLLNPAIGGPSIRPPQPTDIAALGFGDFVTWKEDAGPAKYRRGMYIFFQRTVPYPMLQMFDAPDSNHSCTRRERSNTPLQALTLMNDPVFWECAQGLGTWLTRAGHGEVRETIRQGFRLCLGRAPGAEEVARLEQFHQGYAKRLTASGAGGKEVDAWVGVARVMLNLDEFLTRQ